MSTQVNKLAAQVKAAAGYLQQKLGVTPQAAVVAGSGLGDHLEKLLPGADYIHYSEIPDFPLPTIAGHKGQLISGKLADKPVIIFSGRKHLYEGEPLTRVIFPALLCAELQVPRLVLTNAAGGLNPEFDVGDLMLITEGINLTFRPFLLTELLPQMKLQRLDNSRIFSPRWRTQILLEAKRSGFFLRSGVYIATTGPVYETPAEVGLLRYLGGDAIGMSTVPEAMAAAALGLEVLGISFISNQLAAVPLRKTTHAEVLQAAAEAAPRLADLIVRAANLR